jgi:RNA polymerase sigma factor (sigma-70 family)
MVNDQLGGVVRHIHRLVGPSSLDELTDGQLLERFARQREEAAFATLVRRHGPMVLGVCRRVLHGLLGAEDAEDAFQATFLVLFRRARALNRNGSVANWLYTVAYHVALKAKAAAARRQRRERQVLEMPRAGSHLEEVWRDLQPVLDEELSRLPDRYRAPILLCYLEGKTNEEAGRLLGCPTGTIKGRLARARELLRTRLARRGIAFPTGLFGTLLAENAATAVPVSLLDATVQTALGLTAGKTAAPAAALAEGVLKAMFVTRFKIATVSVLAVGLVALGIGALAPPARAQRAPEEAVAGAPGDLLPPTPEEQPRPASPPAPDREADRHQMTVRGRVLSPDGKPLAGTRVAVCGRQGQVLGSGEWWAAFRHGVLGEVKTDKDGKYRLRVPRLDPLMKIRGLHVVATADRHGLAWKGLNPDAEQCEATLRLTAVQPVRGRVLGLQGEPAAGLRIHVTRITRQAQKGESDVDASVRPPESLKLAVKTNDRGEFAFAGFGPNLTLELAVRDPRYERKEEWIVRTADKKQCTNIRLLLAPGRYIEGRVIYQDTGKGVPHARLMIANPIIDTRADAEGRFKVPLYAPREEPLAFRPRDVGISAWPPPGEPHLGDSRGVDFPKGVVKREVVLSLARAALLRGKITEAGSGKPVAGAHVACNAGYDHSVVSGADGSYQIAAPPGSGRLIVTHPSGDYIPQIVGHGGSLGKPVGDPSYHHAAIDVDVKKNEKVKEINVTLRRGVTIKGRLVGPDDKPVSSAVLFVSAHRPRYEKTMHPVLVRNGRFELRGCDPQKTYQLLFLEHPHLPPMMMMTEGLQSFGQLWLAELVNRKDRRGASVKVLAKKAAGQPLVVRVAPCGSVRLRFKDGAGKPRADFIPWLQLVVTPGPPLWKAIEDKVLAAEVVSLAGPYGNQPPGQPKTDARGYVSYHGLIPGATYRIKTYGLDMSRNTVLKDFTVEAGKTAELEIIVK